FKITVSPSFATCLLYTSSTLKQEFSNTQN
ncbi:hypothetical protein A5887_002214, partial [Enterococcus faecium]